MKYLVIAPSLKQFLDCAEDNVGKYTRPNQRKIVSESGDEYIYINNKNHLYGYHGVKVLFCGSHTPDWVDEEVRTLIQIAERE